MDDFDPSPRTRESVIEVAEALAAKRSDKNKKIKRRSVLLRNGDFDDEMSSLRSLTDSVSAMSDASVTIDGNDYLFSDQFVEKFCCQNNVFHVLSQNIEMMAEHLSGTGKVRDDGNTMFLLDTWFIRCWTESLVVRPDEDMDVFIGDLAAKLTQSKHVKVLHLENVPLGEQFFRRAMTFSFLGLKTTLSSLTALHLPFCGISSVTIAAILASLIASERNRYLSILDLSHNALTGASIPVLLLFLRELRLTTLNLRGNVLGGGSVTPDKFDDLLNECGLLVSLDLSFTKLNAEENSAVVHSLKHLTNINELLMEGLNFSPTTAVALSNVVTLLPRLRKLELAFNASCASDAFLSRISSIISKNQSAVSNMAISDLNASESTTFSPRAVAPIKV